MADPRTVDGVTPPDPATAGSSAVRQWKKRLLLLGGVFYLVYILWVSFLLLMLPADGLQGLAQIGAFTMVLGGLFFLVAGFVGLQRIGRTPLPPPRRLRGMVIVGVAALPGILISVLTLFVILQSPPLVIAIASPATAEELVAPVQVTFRIDRVLELLADDGFRPVQFRWDITGDGKVDQETVLPELTVTYDREGVYPVRVTMASAGGGTRVATRRFLIQRAVLSVLPSPVIVNRPTVLSIAHLIQDPLTVTEARWDFNNDGAADQTTKDLQTTYTFFRTGPVTVSVTVLLQNKTQARYERSFEVREPLALPFPVAIVSEPRFLIGPEPFATLWRIDSREDIAQVLWDFGDGERAEGTRAAHTFQRRGTHVVQAKIFARSGSSADLSTVVQVVERLSLPDLLFEGTPTVQGDRIQGEVPLTLNIRPRTSASFVQFSWEVPEATEVGSTEDVLQAIYRREGTYTVTLIARDAENRVLRKPITVEVKPPSSLLTFRMDPETGIAPLPVKFDASETFIPGETITGFEWNFGDSTQPKVGGARIDHVFEREGTYLITLTVKTTSGQQFRATQTIAVRASPLQACLLPSRKSGQAPLGVLFISCSTGNIQSLLWDFGDLSQSDAAEHVHVYEDPGQYIVTLTVTDTTGRTSRDSVSISVQP